MINMQGICERFISQKVNEYRAKSSKNLTSTSTVEEWEKKRVRLKQKILDSIGGLPDFKAVNAKLVNIVDKDNYVIENILLETLPEIFLNLNLYIPKNLQFPLPTVVFATGHSTKLDPPHQYPVNGLVQKGYIVATFDCWGRGEREEGNEHFEVGALSWLMGRNMVRYFVHDNIKVIDYLYTRIEVNKEKIGTTGISGGGYTTLLHGALDERTKCIAPACAIGSFCDYINLEYSGCPEYYPFGILKEGVDGQDLIALCAPRPFVFLLGGKDVGNDVYSTQKSIDIARHIYRLYNRENDVEAYVDWNAPHDFTHDLRERMYKLMDECFSYEYGKNVKVDGRDEFSLLKEETEFLFHHTNNLIIYETEYLKNCKREYVSDKKEVLLKCLGLKDRPICYKNTYSKVFYQNEIAIENVILNTEVEIPLSVMYPRNMKTDKLLFVIDDKGYKKLFDDPKYEKYIQNGYILIAADIRTTGQNMLTYTAWENMSVFSNDRAISGAAFLIGYPLIGQAVYDSMCVIDFIKNHYSLKDIHLDIISQGENNIIAKCIEILMDANKNIIDGEEFSLNMWFDTKNVFDDSLDVPLYVKTRQRYNYSSIIPGILKHFDI